MNDFLFVYGTLLKQTNGTPHPLLEGHANFIGTGCLPGKLYEIDNYPGAIPLSSASAMIHGEVYTLHYPNLLLGRLDEYEECSRAFSSPHEYLRQRHSVTLDNGSCVSAWVYVYNRPVAKHKQILSGDYRPYLTTQNVT